MGAVAEAVACRRRDLRSDLAPNIWPERAVRVSRCGDIVKVRLQVHSVGMIEKHPGAKCFRTLETRSAQSDPAQVERELVGDAVAGHPNLR